jgi:hypothetical protein
VKARILALQLQFATWRIEVWNARAARFKAALSDIMETRP